MKIPKVMIVLFVIVICNVNAQIPEPSAPKQTGCWSSISGTVNCGQRIIYTVNGVNYNCICECGGGMSDCTPPLPQSGGNSRDGSGYITGSGPRPINTGVMDHKQEIEDWATQKQIEEDSQKAIKAQQKAAKAIQTKKEQEEKARIKQEKEQLSAKLASLRGEIKATQGQLMKLNKAILADINQYNEWEKVSTEGLNKCNDIYWSVLLSYTFDLLFGKKLDRYDEMEVLANKLPDKPAQLIKRIKDTRILLEKLSYTPTIYDAYKLAVGEGTTAHEIAVGKGTNVYELRDQIRDGIGLILEAGNIEFKRMAFDGTWEYAKYYTSFNVAAQTWQWGSLAFDLGHTLTQLYFDWNAIKQLDHNEPTFTQAIQSLHNHLDTVITQEKIVEKKLRNL